MIEKHFQEMLANTWYRELEEHEIALWVSVIRASFARVSVWLLKPTILIIYIHMRYVNIKSTYIVAVDWLVLNEC